MQWSDGELVNVDVLWCGQNVNHRIRNVLGFQRFELLQQLPHVLDHVRSILVCALREFRLNDSGTQALYVSKKATQKAKLNQFRKVIQCVIMYAGFVTIWFITSHVNNSLL